MNYTAKTVTVQERVQMAQDFLKKLFRYMAKGEKIFSYLWLLNQDKSKKNEFDKKSMFFDVTDDNAISGVANKAIELNDSGLNVFVGVNLTDKPSDVNKRAKEENITVQTAIIADIDVANGLWHDGEKYPADFDTAKNFLPFEPSILVDSGAGLHAYILLNAPIRFNTSEERDQAVSRNKAYIEMIRANAGTYSGAVDGVHDLPRVLRLPGTYNLKGGVDNARLCQVVATGAAYSLTDLQDLIKPAPAPAQKISLDYSPQDNAPTDIERARAMLEVIPCSTQTYADWIAVGMILKNNGNDCADWIAWSSTDTERFKVGECERKWAGFQDNGGLTIATLHYFAKNLYGYSEKDFQRDWHKTHDSTNNKKFAQSDDSLKEKLRDVNKKLAEFEVEKNAAIAKIQSVEIPVDKDIREFAFATDIVTAAAHCEISARKVLSDFKALLKQKIGRGENFIADWNKDVKDKAADITARHEDLLAQRKSIQAKIGNANFQANNPDFSGCIIPDGYSVDDSGIKKICGKNEIVVALNPVVICEKRMNYADNTFQYVLKFKENGSKYNLPPTDAAVIFNARKLNDLAAFGLPVTSGKANLLVEYLDNFRAVNSKDLPLTYEMARVGLYNLKGKDIFVDPRRKNSITDGEKNIEIVVKKSPFTDSLKTKGTFEEWRKAYDLVKNAPIARLIVAASVAAPLLKILRKRNFVLYTYGTTRAGKSTALLLGAAAVGNTDLVVSFDGTKGGLLGRIAETNDYSFWIDEKQSADKNLKVQFKDLVYSAANGKERVRLNRDGSLKPVRSWQNILICNGETELIDDTATGGALTRLLQIPTPKTILSDADCETIRGIIQDNYGHAFMRVVDKYFDYGFEKLKEKFNEIVSAFKEEYKKVEYVYCEYMAVMMLADIFLNMTFGIEEETAENEATIAAGKIFQVIPTRSDISDADREFNLVADFIAQNQKYFVKSDDKVDELPFVYGRYTDEFVYITMAALKKACNEGGLDYNKVIADLVDAEKFISGNNKTVYVQTKIGEFRPRCFRIKTNFL